MTYIGAALAGAPIALIQGNYSWSGVIFLILSGLKEETAPFLADNPGSSYY